ncbi:MAG: histidine phosphatase family protein [Anaerolineae bacterium]
MDTILTLVRHGQTEANLSGLWQGATDGLLTARGQAQARQVADYLARLEAEVAALYTSPLRRAHDTATAIGQALGLPPQLEPDLAEYNLGDWEGQTFEALRDTFRLWERTRQDPDFAPPGGESPRQVVTRIVAALRRIAAAHPGRRVVVVSHGGALSLGLALLVGNDPLAWADYRLDNCAVSELVLSPRPHLLTFNETSHLDGVGG